MSENLFMFTRSNYVSQYIGLPIIHLAINSPYSRLYICKTLIKKNMVSLFPSLSTVSHRSLSSKLARQSSGPSNLTGESPTPSGPHNPHVNGHSDTPDGKRYQVYCHMRLHFYNSVSTSWYLSWISRRTFSTVFQSQHFCNGSKCSLQHRQSRAGFYVSGLRPELLYTGVISYGI